MPYLGPPVLDRASRSLPGEGAGLDWMCSCAPSMVLQHHMGLDAGL